MKKKKNYLYAFLKQCTKKDIVSTPIKKESFYLINNACKDEFIGLITSRLNLPPLKAKRI